MTSPNVDVKWISLRTVSPNTIKHKCGSEADMLTTEERRRKLTREELAASKSNNKGDDWSRVFFRSQIFGGRR